MQPHSLKLSPESDLIICIKEFSFSNNIFGYVSGVVGNLSKACIQCPGDQKINKFEGNLEIVSLNGHFNNGDVHLHLSFADEGCNVFGGHLEKGSIVKKGTDILLISFEKKIIDKKINEVIFALSATIEADTTSFYLFKILNKLDVKVSVLARGIPVGDQLEYTDEVTLARSIQNRRPYESNISNQ